MKNLKTPTPKLCYCRRDIKVKSVRQQRKREKVINFKALGSQDILEKIHKAQKSSKETRFFCAKAGKSSGLLYRNVWNVLIKIFFSLNISINIKRLFSNEYLIFCKSFFNSIVNANGKLQIAQNWHFFGHFSTFLFWIQFETMHFHRVHVFN